MKNRKDAYNKLNELLDQMIVKTKSTAEKAVNEVDPTNWSRFAEHAKVITVNGKETIMTW